MAFALIPTLLGRDWWNTWDYPRSIVDQFFGDPIFDHDLMQPSLVRGFVVRPRTQASKDSSGKSEVKNDDKQLEIALNVSQFKPEELEVKIVNNFIVIHAKHEEKSDEHGFISREFTRKYMLPTGCEEEKVTSSLSPDGVLTIVAPKKAIEDKPAEERNVPIAQSDTKAVEGEK